MNEFSHLKNKLLAEQVEDQIYHYILDTPIEPGAKLPNEFELGEKFGVGQTAVQQGHRGSAARVGYLRSDNHQGPVRPAGPAFRQG